jgi:hypothetical protein
MVCIESVLSTADEGSKVLGVDITFGLIEDWTFIMRDTS